MLKLNELKEDFDLVSAGWELLRRAEDNLTQKAEATCKDCFYAGTCLRNHMALAVFQPDNTCSNKAK